jgi:hypothetical protein
MATPADRFRLTPVAKEECVEPSRVASGQSRPPASLSWTAQPKDATRFTLAWGPGGVAVDAATRWCGSDDNRLVGRFEFSPQPYHQEPLRAEIGPPDREGARFDTE